MDNSFFSSHLQSILSQVLFKLLDNPSPSGTGETPKLTWIYPTKKESGKSSVAGGGSFDELIEKISAKYDVDAALVKAVIKAESNFNPKAVSSAGAQGLMQLMPSTAAGLGVMDAFDPEQNVDGGVRFLCDLLKRYSGSVELALAAYNAGPGAVDRYGGIPPYQETQTYVNRVVGYMKSSREWSA